MMDAKKTLLEAESSVDIPLSRRHETRPSGSLVGGASLWIFLGWCATLAVVFFSPLRRLVDLSLTYDHYSHIPLVPLVALYFFFVERRPIFAQTRLAGAWGLLPALPGAGLAWWAFSNQAGLGENDFLAAAILALWLCLAGGFLAAFGTASFKQALFSLGFLLFGVPIPQVLLDALVGILQAGSAEVTHWFFLTTSVPVFREGFYFSLPGLDIVVAPQCSGIRSSIALLITSVVAGRLFLTDNLNRVLLVFVALPVTIFKNGLRIATLCYLSIYVDREFLTGSLHNQGGHAFFVLALLMMAPALILLRRRETPESSEPEQSGASTGEDSSSASSS